MSGSQMALEMAEQPARLRDLIARADEVTVGTAEFDGVTIVARGSSDHAAVYGRYLLEAATGKPVSLAAPSLHTLYRISADYRGQLIVAVSQSGQTPEIVETLRALCAGGGRGLAITNDSSSSLAAAGRRRRPRRPAAGRGQRTRALRRTAADRHGVARRRGGTDRRRDPGVAGGGDLRGRARRVGWPVMALRVLPRRGRG